MPSWIIILIIIAAAVAADVVYLVRRKKRGECSCGHDCKSCAAHGSCHSGEKRG
ncbi:MAG: FeoB-associated Cys-rich membrane protein [Clostridia bacterium]|nr:FeoB-associated Cys-rich membrane protein [Clostridia bacterium]